MSFVTLLLGIGVGALFDRSFSFSSKGLSVKVLVLVSTFQVMTIPIVLVIFSIFLVCWFGKWFPIATA